MSTIGFIKRGLDFAHKALGHRGEINTLRGMQGMPTVMAAQGTH
jgi:hypothetical protein